jgi:transposase
VPQVILNGGRPKKREDLERIFAASGAWRSVGHYLREAVEVKDLMPKGIVEDLGENCGIHVDIGTVRRLLKEEGYVLWHGYVRKDNLPRQAKKE